MRVSKLGQVFNFTKVGGIAKHCVDQYVVLFSYYSLGGRYCYAGWAKYEALSRISTVVFSSLRRDSALLLIKLYITDSSLEQFKRLLKTLWFV